MNALSPRESTAPATAVSDRELARTVGCVVAVARPAVAGLRLASLLAGLTPVPVVNAYPRRDAAGRADWWILPVGTATTVLVAWPSALGPLARLLPVGTVLGFANQTVIAVGVAGEYGVTDYHQQVELVARVLARRQIDAAELLPEVSVSALIPVGDVVAQARSGLFGVVGAARSVLGGVRAAQRALGTRPQPAPVFDLLGRVPVVGAVAGYLGESATLRPVRDRAADGARILGLEAVFAGSPAGEGD
ncbi:hypothetical protein P0W64_06360 [Tsukamurella sp. 8F]|uniref:hypothetical protein n=1 Tax=unclassified Tsukamurella TaxID=2633480 RepID=UPI0023B8D776|nr:MULTISPECIES: hypothetical protein [unclassified Tsukamurella]MDF0530075.1 hypothetical protein [Tsukamurella sp. 8J]MDF0586393.1 hypothetical protein [Tsukamurella sp. 8F]